MEEIALIAREISQYSILAVVTHGSDDGSRPIVCYRYFWLENADTDDFDGVATLLKWWEEKDKPYCEIKPWAEYENELTENGEDFYQATPIDKKYSEPFQQQTKSYQKQTNKNLDANQIEEKPYIFSIHKNDSVILPNYWGIHALALQLNNKYENAEIAWSWKTSVIDEPSNFTLICCADERNCDRQKQWYSSSSQKLVIRPNYNPLASVTSSYRNLSQELIKIAQKNQQLKYDDSPTLYKSLETGDSTTWDYQQLIDATAFMKKLDENERIYFELIILLLNPNGVTKQTPSGRIDINIRDFINKIIPQSNQTQPGLRGRISTQKPQSRYLDTVIPQTRIAMMTMQRFLYFCDKSLSEESYKRLTRNVYEIINQLFLEIILSTPSQESLKAVKTIIFDDFNEKNQLSAYHFQIYFRGYKNKLISWLNNYYKYKTNRSIKSIEKNNNIDDFCKQVIKDLIAYEHQTQNKNVPYAPEEVESVFAYYNEIDELTAEPKSKYTNPGSETINKTGTTKTQQFSKFSKYKEIAKIFYSAQCYNLAAFFCQLSLGYVPQEIYNKCRDFYEIIELTQQKKNLQSEETLNNSNIENTINDRSFSPNMRIIRNFFVNSFVGLIVLGIGAGGAFFINRLSSSSSPSFTVDEADPFSEKFEYYRELSQQGYYPRTMTQVNNSLLNDISKINDENTGIPELKDFPRDNEEKKAKELQKAFIEERKARIQNIGAYPEITSLTPQIDKELSEEILAEMTVAKASADNATVNENVQQLSATIQPVLQSLGFYKIKPLTNTWDKGTSDAIKKFQQHYKLQETGDLDQATWDILYIMIKDKQVKETAIVLESILKFRQNSRESEEKITELENCKNEPFTYLQCIDKLKTKPAN
ncbi:MAG: peptidoglycan-binding domain-containing protein [Crocosphaera sp.]